MKTLTLVLFLVISLGARCFAGTTGILNGYVLDDKGQLDANASVKVASASHTETRYTDRHGRYIFFDLPPDVYIIDVEDGASNFSAYSVGIRISSDQTTFVRFQFGWYRRCPTIVQPSLANDQRSQQYTEVNVNALEAYPLNAHSLPLPVLPMAPRRTGNGCL